MPAISLVFAAAPALVAIPASGDTVITPALPEARVVVELGRYIVGECGISGE